MTSSRNTPGSKPMSLSYMMASPMYPSSRHGHDGAPVSSSSPSSSSSTARHHDAMPTILLPHTPDLSPSSTFSSMSDAGAPLSSVVVHNNNVSNVTSGSSGSNGSNHGSLDGSTYGGHGHHDRADEMELDELDELDEDDLDDGHAHKKEDGVACNGAHGLSLHERRQRNKTASAKYRQKKNRQQVEMKRMIDALTEQDSILKRQVAELRVENQRLRSMNDHLRSKILAKKMLDQYLERHHHHSPSPTSPTAPNSSKTISDGSNGSNGSHGTSKGTPPPSYTASTRPTAQHQAYRAYSHANVSAMQRHHAHRHSAPSLPSIRTAFDDVDTRHPHPHARHRHTPSLNASRDTSPPSNNTTATASASSPPLIHPLHAINTQQDRSDLLSTF